MPRAFFGTFFRAERKYCPSRGGSPSVRARVGASIPNEEVLTAKLTHIDACSFFPFVPLLHSDRLSKQTNKPIGLQVPTRARVGASIPAKKFPYSIAIVYSGLQMIFRVANNRQISKRRPPASFPKIYRFELLLLNWAIIRNFFSLALI